LSGQYYKTFEFVSCRSWFIKHQSITVFEGQWTCFVPQRSKFESHWCL